MLDEVLHWLNVVITVTDVLLLLRVLMLRLHRVYMFVTLYCALTVVLDAGQWITGTHGLASDRLLVYSRFVVALVFPLAAWDVFEEVQEQTAKFRRLHALRLISGLIITAVFGLIFSAIAASDEDTGPISQTLVGVALLFWAATASASALFVWNMRRTMQKLQIALPPNTQVLAIFFLIILLCELAECLLLVAGPWLAPFAPALEISFGVINLGLVLWCTLRLRRISSGEPAPQNAGAA
jgi:hypothetical protein